MGGQVPPTRQAVVACLTHRKKSEPCPLVRPRPGFGVDAACRWPMWFFMPALFPVRQNRVGSTGALGIEPGHPSLLLSCTYPPLSGHRWRRLHDAGLVARGTHTAAPGPPYQGVCLRTYGLFLNGRRADQDPGACVWAPVFPGRQDFSTLPLSSELLENPAWRRATRRCCTAGARRMPLLVRRAHDTSIRTTRQFPRRLRRRQR